LKFLVLVLVVIAVYWIFRSHKKKPGGASRRNGAGPPVEDMVRCTHCGVHLPRSESIAAGEVFFCTPEHRRLHVKTD
jgi:uncharacterized protein